MARLLQRYKNEVVKALVEEFGYKNPMVVPRLEKIVVSMGVGAAVQDRKRLDDAARDLALITGQKPLMCKARKSVSNFKLRKGMIVGLKVTLRGLRMYEFLDRLISVAIPRVRDFRGLSPNGFDGRGNYTLAIDDELVFPELNYDDVTRARGMDITIVTTAETDEEAAELLRLCGMPLAER